MPARATNLNWYSFWFVSNPLDGGALRINWKQTKKNSNWGWWHVQAWERSKLYETDPATWRVKHAAYKKAREELRRSKTGERTLAENKADLQAQLDALE